jgi:hypothetical protein
MLLRPLLLLLAAVTALPDEGQWLPTQVRAMDWDALRKRGMTLTKDEFWHPEHGGVLSATVQINGCTASFVSQDGLLVTNHHCGFGAISELSTPERNLLHDGFAAADRGAELPAPGMVASVLKRIEDVTAVVHEAQAKATDDLERWSLTQSTIARLCAEGEQKEANTKCSVASFLEGKEYHLYYRTQIRDVRLVYAPPRAIGEFGGEVDNWEWPRHTGDFCFFRAYVGRDGAVRDLAPDNVPFQPKHFLKVATAGVQPGDLAIIMGYPGRTQRYKTSRGVALQQGFVYPKRHEVLTAAIAVLEAAGKTDPRLALAVADNIKSLANVQKNAAGMMFGLQRNATTAKKQAEEQQFTAWLAGGQRDAGWKTVLDEMLAIDEVEATTIERDTLVSLVGMLADGMPVLMTMVEACGAVAANPDGKVPGRLLKALGDASLTTHWATVERPLLQILLGEFATMGKTQRIAGTEFLGDGAIDAAAVARVFDSPLLDAKARGELFARGQAKTSDDALVALARALAAERLAVTQRQRQRAGKMLDVGRRWIAAQEAFRGTSFYPDANSTLRVSIAEVGGYVPQEAVTYAAQTTVGGLVAKETGREPFANPKALLEAAKTRQSSRWLDPRLGDVPVCFLTNGDTTGGNSGSPVVNGKGELIGLNFDRVFENVAGDFGWNQDRSRNVVCDIRYVLWVVESVFPSPTLLAELGARH